LVLEAVKAIRDKSAKAIIASTFDGNLDFLEECFKAELLNFWDAIALNLFGDLGLESLIPHYNLIDVKN
jgi:hypothetical protein